MAALGPPVRCGELACQRDSYARRLTATVLSVQPKQAAPDHQKAKKKGKAEQLPPQPLFECTLTDTVLFPEGGGQPSDRGKVGAADCLRVDNVDGVPIHTVTGPPLKVGAIVDVEVDWARRWDHAQQHSAQHLLSAVALSDDFQRAETLSWSLGAESCFVELSAAFDPSQVGALERAANAAIRRGNPVAPEWHPVADVHGGRVPGLRLSSCKLPDSVTGLVRVVRFSDLDTNTCCGTHVATTAHLQALKIVKCERAKSGTHKVHFLAGDRVLER